jgi:hypothetical protein
MSSGADVNSGFRQLDTILVSFGCHIILLGRSQKACIITSKAAQSYVYLDYDSIPFPQQLATVDYTYPITSIPGPAVWPDFKFHSNSMAADEDIEAVLSLVTLIPYSDS